MTSGRTVPVSWLEPLGESNSGSGLGSTFAISWAPGLFQGTGFHCSSDTGNTIPSQTWVTGFWPDDSIKFTAHAIPRIPQNEPVPRGYCIHVSAADESNHPEPEKDHGAGPGDRIRIRRFEETIEVDTGRIIVSFATNGDAIVRSIVNGKGRTIGENGRLVLLLQPVPTTKGPSEDCGYSSPAWESFRGRIDDIAVSQEAGIRTLITVRGTHYRSANLPAVELPHDQADFTWIPFVLRFYLYAGSEAVRVVHTITYDGDPCSKFIRGIGLRFDVPLHGLEPYRRHVRIAGQDGGILSESVQGLTGLWRDPGIQVRKSQVQGRRLPPIQEWNQDVLPLLQWVPTWGDYNLTQLSPDGFTAKKRTKAGHSWVNVPGGTCAGGLVYLGSAENGGLAVAMRHFWERYPTSLDVRSADEDVGQITLWLYSPSAEPMDLRPYHDGLGQKTFEDQLDALKITYEDWEDRLGSPYGISRTNEIFIFGLDETPTSYDLSQFVSNIRNPPVLVPTPEYIHSTSAFGNYWSLSLSREVSTSPAVQEIEHHLEFLFDFYSKQIKQRRWYGFWDHGDIMHTYDTDRHTWRYDVGGYAWDNSELSPDLWLWLYFLKTGRADVYRLAEALTRHTSEVDAYHLGPYRGLGTRHGVQHWSDSCKQARVSNAIYRRIFYFLSGGDERTGELLEETLLADGTFLIIDPYRKVRKDRDTYVPEPKALNISLGTDWSAVAASWFIAWERRGGGWVEAKRKLLASLKGIGALRNGFVTGNASYNLETGEISPPANDPDNSGVVKISHLSAMFGLVEIVAELVHNLGDEGLPPGFRAAWLDYCRFFNADSAEQKERYGVDFGKLQLRQGHSRLTAYAAAQLQDKSLAKSAWHEFYTGDGYGSDLPWRSEAVKSSDALVPVEEALWISTNITSLYGLAAVQLMAFLQDFPTEVPEKQERLDPVS